MSWVYVIFRIVWPTARTKALKYLRKAANESENEWDNELVELIAKSAEDQMLAEVIKLAVKNYRE